MLPREQIRNIAIIAHVDHGKTTLVDFLFRQTGTFRANEQVQERAMDSSDLEREKGITILAKNTAVTYRGVKINIVDTPGHADFGGEVERGLRLGDGVLLLVDAADEPLLDEILETVPPPRKAETTHDKLQMLVANLDYDDYVGRLAVGRLSSGSLEVGQTVAVCRADGSTPRGKVSKIYCFDGLKKIEIPEAGPGEIICLAGLEDISIGDTIADPEHPIPLERIHVDEPTMSMGFKVNDRPVAGRQGKYVTSPNLPERPQPEATRNVSLRLFDTESPDAFKVLGRGELQLAVIVETMRREGDELTVSNPEPITREVDGVVHEPMELMVCDGPQAAGGPVTARLGPRKGRMVG